MGAPAHGFVAKNRRPEIMRTQTSKFASHFAGILMLCMIPGITGCASPAKEVSGPEVMANLTSDPLDCMIYRGSDSEFYYFDRARFKTTEHFKVRHEELELPSDVRVGQIPIGMKLRDAEVRPEW